MSDPSPTDIANAEARPRIADRQNKEYREAQLIALSALGPGYTPWINLGLIDADHRQTCNTEPVATVYKPDLQYRAGRY